MTCISLFFHGGGEKCGSGKPDRDRGPVHCVRRKTTGDVQFSFSSRRLLASHGLFRLRLSSLHEAWFSRMVRPSVPCCLMAKGPVPGTTLGNGSGYPIKPLRFRRLPFASSKVWISRLWRTWREVVPPRALIVS